MQLKKTEMPIASHFQVMNLNIINMGNGGVCSKEKAKGRCNGITEQLKQSKYHAVEQSMIKEVGKGKIRY